MPNFIDFGRTEIDRFFVGDKHFDDILIGNKRVSWIVIKFESYKLSNSLY